MRTGDQDTPEGCGHFVRTPLFVPSSPPVADGGGCAASPCPCAPPPEGGGREGEAKKAPALHHGLRPAQGWRWKAGRPCPIIVAQTFELVKPPFGGLPTTCRRQVSQARAASAAGLDPCRAGLTVALSQRRAGRRRKGGPQGRQPRPAGGARTPGGRPPEGTEGTRRGWSAGGTREGPEGGGGGRRAAQGDHREHGAGQGRPQPTKGPDPARAEPGDGRRRGGGSPRPPERPKGSGGATRPDRAPPTTASPPRRSEGGDSRGGPKPGGGQRRAAQWPGAAPAGAPGPSTPQMFRRSLGRRNNRDGWGRGASAPSAPGPGPVPCAPATAYAPYT